MDESNYKRLMRIADMHEQKAEEKYYEYMDSGSPSTMRTVDRHRQLAEDFRCAAQAARYKTHFIELKYSVLALMDYSGEDLEDKVRFLAKKAEEMSS